jgi:hypothetical protein
VKFAERLRLRVKRDECSDPIIPGRRVHIYNHGDGRFLASCSKPRQMTPSSDRTLLKQKHKALDKWVPASQEGDVEAILLFDPEDTKQARLAIRLMGATTTEASPFGGAVGSIEESQRSPSNSPKPLRRGRSGRLEVTILGA